MPVLRDIGSDFAREKPFAGLKIALSVHLEAKTAYLCRVLELPAAPRCTSPAPTRCPLRTTWPRRWRQGGIEVHADYGCCATRSTQAHLRSVLARRAEHHH